MQTGHTINKNIPVNACIRITISFTFYGEAILFYKKRRGELSGVKGIKVEQSVGIWLK